MCAVLSVNRVIIAAAGGGKTTRIAREAIEESTRKVALVTYTLNNVKVMQDKLYLLAGVPPPHVEVFSWFSFLLRELARPYRNALHGKRIEGLYFVEGRSSTYAKSSNINKYYFTEGQLIYSDKIARFVCECDKATNGAVMNRLKERFDHIYVDEVQDLAGYDLDLLQRMLEAGIQLTLVGDHRQATFSTNNAAKNAGYAKSDIILKFEEWCEAGLLELTYEIDSYRCQQSIVDLADMFFEGEPKTSSQNTTFTGHDGVFSIQSAMVDEYVVRFRPQVLRLDRKTPCGEYFALNFGESKGMTFDRVLIFPHKGAVQWLISGDFSKVLGSAAKMYVGITRAKSSVTFVFDGQSAVPGIIPLATFPD